MPQVLKTLNVYHDIATLSAHDRENNLLQLSIAQLLGEINVTEGGVISTYITVTALDA